MTEPVLPSLLAFSLAPGAIPAAVILLGAALSNAGDSRTLRGHCRNLLPPGSPLPPLIAESIIAVQSLAGFLLLTSPSLILSALCLTGLLLSRGMALRLRQSVTRTHLHLGITGRLPQPACVFLDALLTLSLSGTLLSTRSLPLEAPGLSALAGAALITTAILLLARRSLQSGPLIQPRPLQVGRSWPTRRAGTLPDSGSVLVLLMRPGCPDCQSWLRLLRARAAMGYFYPLHVIWATGDTADSAAPRQATETHITLPPETLVTLSATLPCALLVHQGVIVTRWADSLPPDWMSPHPPAPEIPQVRPRLRQRHGLQQAPGRKAAENHRYFSPGPV